YPMIKSHLSGTFLLSSTAHVDSMTPFCAATFKSVKTECKKQLKTWSTKIISSTDPVDDPMNIWKPIGPSGGNGTPIRVIVEIRNGSQKLNQWARPSYSAATEDSSPTLGF